MEIGQYIEKFRKPALIFAGLIATYTLAGFVLLPMFMESKIPELIETETGRKASIDKIEFNPFSLELSLQGFAMQEQDAQTFVSFADLSVNVQVWASLFNLALVLDELKLIAPYVRIEHLKNDLYNFSDLITETAEPEEPEESSDIFPIIIHHLILAEGKFETINKLNKEPVDKLIDDINFQLDNFSTLAEAGADLGFSMTLNNSGSLTWHGNFSVNPISSKGDIKIEGLYYPDVWEIFLQGLVQFKWVEGQQLIVFNYELSYPDDELLFNLTEGQLLTKDLKFTGKENPQEFLNIPYLLVDGIEFDLNKQTVDIAKIESNDTAVDLWYGASGQLNYASFFAPVEEGNTPQETEKDKQEPESTPTALPWVVNIQEIAVNTVNINYSDKRNNQEIMLKVASLGLGLKDYHLQLDELLQITANDGYLNLQTLVLDAGKDAELINIPTLNISGVDVNLQDQNIAIKSINTSDAYIKSWLAKNGELNFQSLFAPTEQGTDEAELAPEQTDSNAKPWLLELQEFKIENYAIQFKDYTTATPAIFDLTGLHFSVTDIDTKSGTRLPFTFNTLFNKKGKIKITGQSVIEPFKTDLDIVVSKLGLDAFEPYVQENARLDIVGGNINTQGKLSVSQAKQAELKLQYKGNIDIRGLHTRDQILNQDFLKWQQLKLSGFDFSLHQSKLNIKSVNLTKPYARVTIKEDKTTNINDVLISQEKPAKKEQSQKKSSTAFVYNINKFSINNGGSDFSDYSLILPFVVRINGLEGDIKNITSNNNTKTKVDLKGKAFDLSPVEIKGDFNAEFDDFDIAMHFKSLPLPFISPYMVEFSGNKIEKGKMTLDLQYQVNGEQLDATNSLVIDQFELGEEVDNPDAVSLPLGLAAVLLKDKDGRITINMPLKGSLDDPEFSVTSLLLDVFINLIIKVAASPFSAIGSFLQSDGDFSVVTFAPGSPEIDTEQSDKLNGLASALGSKTELTLEVRGAAYTNQDWPSMNSAALLDQLKQIHAKKLKAEGKTQLAEYIELTEDQYNDLLADLFIKTFPELAERSLFGTPKLIFSDMGEFHTVAKNMLQSMIKPDSNKLLRLALTRARNIARYLVETGGIEQVRIFILDGNVTVTAENEMINSELILKVQ